MLFKDHSSVPPAWLEKPTVNWMLCVIGQIEFDFVLQDKGENIAWNNIICCATENCSDWSRCFPDILQMLATYAVGICRGTDKAGATDALAFAADWVILCSIGAVTLF